MRVCYGLICNLHPILKLASPLYNLGLIENRGWTVDIVPPVVDPKTLGCRKHSPNVM